MWIFVLKKTWKERLSVSRMSQKEAHYLWLLNDKSWNCFESRQDKRLVLNVTFDFNGLKQKPSFWLCKLYCKLLTQFPVFFQAARENGQADSSTNFFFFFFFVTYGLQNNKLFELNHYSPYTIFT